MEAADEKLTALKKAYADIILSISKEAAERVMASERKSVRFQQELKVVKEEGVRMLIRLKQMMDSQISEAEAASLNQQKKIEELEAQLQEAEDIVRDLREELNEMQAELEMVKSENSHDANEHLDVCTGVPMEKKFCSYQSNKHLPPNESSVAFDVMVPYLSHRNEYHKQHIVCTCNPYTCNPYSLPSILLRGKDPGLYRNWCTQRIRACDRNLLNSDLCLSEEPDKVNENKKGQEQKEGRHSSKAPVSGAKSLSELEKKLLADINLGTFQSFSWKRKRAVRRRKTVITLAGKQLHLFAKPDQLPEHALTSDPISVNKNTHCAENPSKIVPRLSQDRACPKIAEPQIQLGSEKASGSEGNIVQIYSVMTMHKDGGASDKVVPLRDVTAFSGGPSTDCRMDVEIFDEPSHSLESNSSDKTKGLSGQPVRERVIKYTFQRKRKRQVLSGSEMNGSHESEKKTEDGLNGNQYLEQPKPSLSKKSLRDLTRCESEVNDSRERKTGDVQKCDKKIEQSKPSLLKNSSRDRRRLAQVARQLISLSEKKWWH